MKRRLVLLAVVPGVLITAVAAVVFWLAAGDATGFVLPAGAVLVCAVLVTAGVLASAEARSIADRAARLWRMAAWARTPAAPPAPPPPPAPPRPRVRSHEQAEVFDHLARRLQSLVHREIGLLDELENEVEDPDLLKGIFRVDHLATRIRRYAENIAVLGGGVSDRMWTRPVSVNDVLRSAVAEIEQYRRVKLVPPVPGMLHGHAVVDVVHLLAELAENATMFSPPQTQVLVRAEYATAGLAVEIEDRGLGMDAAQRTRMNALLATRGTPIPDDLVRDGRIGLFVVATIARQHGIAVQLQSNIFGGTQAVLVLPHELLTDSPKAAPAEPVRVPEPAALPQRRRHPVPAIASARTSADAPSPASAQASGRTDGAAPVPAPGSGAVAGNPVLGVAAPSTAGGAVSAAPGLSAAAVEPGDGAVSGRAAGAASAVAAASLSADPGHGAGSASQAGSAAVPGGDSAATPGVGEAPAHGAAPGFGSSLPPGPAAAPGSVSPGDPRPSLPTRNPQGHLPAELREPAREAGRLEDVEHSPGLMAAFQFGIRQADDDHRRSEHGE